MVDVATERGDPIACRWVLAALGIGPAPMIWIFGGYAAGSLIWWSTSLPTAWAFPSLTSILLLGTLGGIVAARVRAAPRRISNPAHRVRLVVHPGWGRTKNEAMDERFEPVVARVWSACSPPGLTARLAALLVVWGTMLAAVEDLNAHAAIARPLGSLGLVGVGLALLLAAFNIKPVYYRVAPGRLDLLRFGWLGRGGGVVASWPLRRARVLVDLNRGELLIGPGPDDAGKQNELWDRLPIGTLRRQTDFVLALLAAARSDAPAPALPDRDLVG
jgi:hypothetical protein